MQNVTPEQILAKYKWTIHPVGPRIYLNPGPPYLDTMQKVTYPRPRGTSWEAPHDRAWVRQFFIDYAYTLGTGIGMKTQILIESYDGCLSTRIP
jgi:hypothetical protein